MEYKNLYEQQLKLNKMLTDRYEILTERNEILTEGRKILTENNEILTEEIRVLEEGNEELNERVNELDETVDHYQNKILHLECEKDDLEVELEGFQSICNEYLESKDSPWEHLAMWCDEKTTEITVLKDELEFPNGS